MKKLLTVCAFAGAISLNANAQNFGNLLKSLTGGTKTETTTTTTTTTLPPQDAIRRWNALLRTTK